MDGGVALRCKVRAVGWWMDVLVAGGISKQSHTTGFDGLNYTPVAVTAIGDDCKIGEFNNGVTQIQYCTVCEIECLVCVGGVVV